MPGTVAGISVHKVVEKNPALEEITGKEVTAVLQHSELGAGADR